MLAWVVIDRRHLRQPRKSHLPRVLGAIGDSGPAGKDTILTFSLRLSTFNLRIAPSPTLLALCPKSVKQVSSHQSLPHSFLKLPGCVPTIPKMELSSQHSPPSLKFFLFKFLRTLLRFFALTQKATRFFSSDSEVFSQNTRSGGRAC